MLKHIDKQWSVNLPLCHLSMAKKQITLLKPMQSQNVQNFKVRNSEAAALTAVPVCHPYVVSGAALMSLGF